jgi:hypothetical protein
MRFVTIPTSLVLVVGAGLLGASCRDIVAGESIRDSAEELCNTLQRCYGAETYDCATIEERFGRSQAEDQSFLAAFDEQCTESCPGSRNCLDRAPICAERGEACGLSVGCCGTGIGTLKCDSTGSSELTATGGGECCLPDGIACDANLANGGCCTSCEAVGDGRFCGGIRCESINGPCRSSLDCCSRFCALEPGKNVKSCQPKVCADLGDACLSAADCCPSEIASSDGSTTIDCIDNRCSYPPNVLLLAGAPCSEHSECESNECVPIEGSDEKRCAGVGCVPEFADCASDVDCCQGTELGVAPNAYPLVCDLGASSPRCVVNPTCQLPSSPELPPVGCCLIGDVTCVTGTECCSGVCKADKTCAESGEPICADLGCHSLCQVGRPMRTGETPPAGETSVPCHAGNSEPARRSCIDAVVALDGFCGCHAWDEVCVQLARATCGPTPTLVCSL